MERICSSHENQHAPRNAVSALRRGDQARWSPLKRLLLVEEDRVPWRVARYRDRDKVGRELHGIVASESPFDVPRPARHVALVEDALAPETLRELRVVRDVVPMRQEEARDAAPPVDRVDQRLRRAGRVDEDVAFGCSTSQLQAPKESGDVKPQKETFSATGSGNAAIAGRACGRDTVPIEPVGHATSAIIDRNRSASSAAAARRRNTTRPRRTRRASMRRHVSQSMHVSST